MKSMKCLLIVSTLLLTVVGSAAAQSSTWSTQMATTFPFYSPSSEKSVRAVTDAEADTAHYAFIDTNYTKYINFNWWPSSVGADIFISPGLYALNPGSGLRPRLDIYNYGIEIRVHPIFVDYVVGWGTIEAGNVPFHGAPYPPSGASPYLTSVYGGITLNNYRAEVGVLNGDTGYLDPYTPGYRYTAAFLGVSRRFGHYVFAEPDLRIVFPVVLHSGSVAGVMPAQTQHYHLWDFFFGLSVKVGIGFN